MHATRRARWLGWSAIGLLVLATPLFFVPGGGGSYGDPTWAIAGALVLHPAAFAGLAALFTYRELEDDEQAEARIALVGLPAVILGAVVLWLFWA